tara:strand:- start:1500 stop:2417 length:918 start_codon:yes stop_codon:yes gene_type:complete
MSLAALARPFGSLSSDDGKKEGKNFITSSFWACFTIWICNTWWPEVIPFQTFDAPFWGRPDGGTLAAITAVWFIFVWGMGINFVIQLGEILNGSRGISRFLQRKEEPDSVSILARGTIISFLAGTLEELGFRWLLFLGAIASVTLADWLWGTIFGLIMFGIMGFVLAVLLIKLFENVAEWVGMILGACVLIGVVILWFAVNVDPIKWLYVEWLCPLANWATLGYLKDFLFHPHSWAVGAGLVSANAFFRDGHKYQGLFGVVNSWFGGMIFFWILFTHGLIACMVVHFLYDFSIYATVAFMRLFRR